MYLYIHIYIYIYILILIYIYIYNIRPQDCSPLSILPGTDMENEIFLSDDSDENSLKSMMGKCHVLGQQEFEKAMLKRAERKKSDLPKTAAKEKQACETEVLEGDDEANWPVVLCRYRYSS
jgi:hypothetical protein